jgi:dienelactone hydrolase
MAEIVLFHHAQGLTDGVQAFATDLRAAGHTVHLPDMYEGHTIETLDEGLDYARTTGFGTVSARGVAAAEELGTALVYAGFSLGVMPAQQLAQTRAGATGALFFHGCLPVAEFGEAWPAGVPVQVHAMADDPFFAGEDLEAAQALVSSADQAELFLYPGSEHLFTDASLPAFDEAAAGLVRSRTLAFLAGLR